jgi:signal peptidase II
MVVVAAAIVLTLDQVSKSWVVANLDPTQPRDLVGSVLRLHLTFNPGAAFNLATGATWVLTLLAAGVVVVTIVTARRLGSRVWALALGLLLGGALGNLSDRIFRYPGGGRGHVVDFLELPRWPIFNVADMAVVSAAVLIALLAFSGIGIDGKRASSGAGRHEAPRDGRSGEEREEPSDEPPADPPSDEQRSGEQPADGAREDSASPDRKDGHD